MGLDLSRLTSGGDDEPLLNPREVFAALPDRSTKYPYLRDVQAEVLDRWFERRDESDIVIKMNTGGGKTVVGLLALVSSLNEGEGPALYLTPDRYLSEQVVSEAAALGIRTVDNPRDGGFLSSEAVCVTTLHKLFNGKSVFGLDQASRIPVGTLLVDDAHACLQAMRQQFRLEVPSGSEAYVRLMQLLFPSLDHQRRATAEELRRGDPTVTMLVPPWAWTEKQDQVISILTGEREKEWALFSWPLLKEVLPFCRVAVTARSIEIEPPCLPVEVVPSFVRAKRHIYLTATLADDSVLITDFAAEAASIEKPISPVNAGDIGDRMILSPLETHPTLDHDALRNMLARLASDENVVVIVPSGRRAERWADVADKEVYAENLPTVVEELRSGHVGLVVFVNKYDGIDLPDSACRILVIDGLPNASSSLDRVKFSCLDGSEALLQEQMHRIEQGMGRGVRSNEDHCVVLLSDPRLAASVWTYGSQMFSAATAAQLELSRQVARMMEGTDVSSIEDVIRQCLRRDPDWVKASRAALARVKSRQSSDVSKIAISERSAFDLASLGRYQDAVDALRDVIASTEDKGQRGWLKQQAAAYASLYDPTRASELQRSAQQDNRLVLRPADAAVSRNALRAGLPQFDASAQLLANDYDSSQHLLIGIEALLRDLEPDPENVDAFESAMATLGRHLGFSTQRPEKELGAGPDVLWALGGLRFLVIECKSGASTSAIGKRDLAQLGHSMDWFGENYDSTCEATPIIVHPARTTAPDAVPTPGAMALTFEKLADLRAAVQRWSVATASAPSLRADEVGPRLADQNLLARAFPNEWTVPVRRPR